MFSNILIASFLYFNTSLLSVISLIGIPDNLFLPTFDGWTISLTLTLWPETAFIFDDVLSIISLI